MSDNCLFCKIVAGQIPVVKLHEDDELLAFADINPQAPTHFLVIPKRHLSGMGTVGPADEALIGKLMRVGAELARANGAPSFRLVINNGVEAGQTVFHLHLHVLAGRPMRWPPG